MMGIGYTVRVTSHSTYKSVAREEHSLDGAISHNDGVGVRHQSATVV